MARPRKPTAQKLAQGTLRPHREKAKSTVNKPLERIAPDTLDELEGEKWYEFYDIMQECSMLAYQDKLSMELLARTYTKWLLHKDELPKYKEYTNILIKLLSHFGMSPSERSRLGIHKVEKEDKSENEKTIEEMIK